MDSRTWGIWVRAVTFQSRARTPSVGPTQHRSASPARPGRAGEPCLWTWLGHQGEGAGGGPRHGARVEAQQPVQRAGAGPRNGNRSSARRKSPALESTRAAASCVPAPGRSPPRPLGAPSPAAPRRRHSHGLDHLRHHRHEDTRSRSYCRRCDDSRCALALRDVSGDYARNGSAVVAVFRPSNGVWFVQGGATTAWGATGDVPLPLPAAVHRSAF